MEKKNAEKRNKQKRPKVIAKSTSNKNVVILNGHTNYIKVCVIIREKKRQLYFLKYKKESEEPMKFTNFDAARATAKVILKPNTKISYIVVIGEDEYDSSEMQKVGDFYQVYDKNNKKLFIQEATSHIIERIGYLNFENGYSERKDRNYGVERANQFFYLLEDAVQNNLCSNTSSSISRIEKVSSREYILHVKGSTARIHIQSNSKIMDINQIRKHHNQKCIPFIKEVDKFLTMHVFATVDRNEPPYSKYSDKITDIINYLIQYIKDNGDISNNELEYVPLNYDGFILVDREIRSTFDNEID